MTLLPFLLDCTTGCCFNFVALNGNKKVLKILTLLELKLSSDIYSTLNVRVCVCVYGGGGGGGGVGAVWWCVGGVHFVGFI